MRLLTCNIHSGIGGADRRYSLERIVALIAGENPDLICLQEVDSNVPRSGHDDQPTLLGRELKAAASFYQLIVPRGDGGSGNLVLSRWPFIEQHSVCLTRPWSRPRGAQLVVVQTPDGPLHLVNWHLSLSESDRRWQANHLLTHPLFLQSAHLPTLIVGDSNDWLDILEGHCFHKHQFQQATSPSSRFRSFPAFFSIMSLDKVFYRGALQVQEVGIVQSRLARQASDHRPLVLGFQLQPPCEQTQLGSNGQCVPAATPTPSGSGWRRALSLAANLVRTPISNFWGEVQALRRGAAASTSTSPAPVSPAPVGLPARKLLALPHLNSPPSRQRPSTALARP